MGDKQKIIVVGSGPVGSLAALYAASRGHQVEIYELRGDLRDPETALLGFTRSINLALSERGIKAMRSSGHAALLDEVLATSLPIRGRMIHGRRPDGRLYEESQEYDVHGRCIRAIDRGALNETLLNSLEEMPNVRFFFQHKLVGADFHNRKAWFQLRRDGERSEMEINFDLMIGADGAHSAVRYHLMKYVRMNYSQEYIDALWCQFQIQPRDSCSEEDGESHFRISSHHLHIWPGLEIMFIAIPSPDGTFTCTFFGPAHVYDALEADENGQYTVAFFEEHFPGVTALIPPAELVSQFRGNPHLPLISIKCQPHHFSSSAVILGDAAHAMVPFYGQGMNAGLEDVRVLFGLLDAFPPAQRERALDAYTAARVPDAHAINDLALQNYVEMRASVLSPTYRLRKFLEESLAKYVPRLGWQTKYARVSFSNERYSDVVARNERQVKILLRVFAAALGLPAAVGGILVYFRFRRAINLGVAGALAYLVGLVQR